MSTYWRQCDGNACQNQATYMWYLPARPQQPPLAFGNMRGPYRLPDYALQDQIHEGWFRGNFTPPRFEGGFPLYCCDDCARHAERVFREHKSI